MGRRAKLRWGLPVGIAAFAVGASVALPALAVGADPALPKVGAQQLLSRALGSDVDSFSGTVHTDADLGVPALPDSARSSDFASLLSGQGTMRVAKSGEQKQRLGVLGSDSERTYVHNGRTMWRYDSEQRKAVRTTLPRNGGAKGHERMSPDQAAKKVLGELRGDSTVSVGRASEVAGRDAYRLVVKPKSDESLVGSVQVPIDAKTWMPLGLTVLPRGSSQPALDVAFSKLSYAKPADSKFDFDPPAGTKVTKHEVTKGKHARPGKRAGHHDHAGSFSWTKVVQVGDEQAKPKGEAAKYLRQLRSAGTRVSGDYGKGTLVRSKLMTLLVLDDGRMYAGAVTPQAVERAAAKD